MDFALRQSARPVALGCSGGFSSCRNVGDGRGTHAFRGGGGQLDLGCYDGGFGLYGCGGDLGLVGENLGHSVHEWAGAWTLAEVV